MKVNLTDSKGTKLGEFEAGVFDERVLIQVNNRWVNFLTLKALGIKMLPAEANTIMISKTQFYKAFAAFPNNWKDEHWAKAVEASQESEI